MTVHILDMTRSPRRTLCGLTEHFAITPGMDVRTATCNACLTLDETARIVDRLGHPSVRPSKATPSDRGVS